MGEELDHPEGAWSRTAAHLHQRELAEAVLALGCLLVASLWRFFRYVQLGQTQNMMEGLHIPSGTPLDPPGGAGEC